MKKFITLFCALTGIVCLNAKTIYLNTGGGKLWNQGGAVFFSHTWGSGSDSDIKMTHVKGDVYSSEIPDGDNGVVFVRMPNGSTKLDWGTKWNQTTDETIPSGKNCFTINGWGNDDNGNKSTGTWSSYTPPTPEDPTAKYYITGDSALVVDAGVGVAKKWNKNAIKSENDSYVLSLKKDTEYKLKVVTTAEDWLGYNDLTTKADGLQKDKDGNICFSLTADGNVTVTYTGSVFKLDGSFYVKPVTKRTIKFVPSEEWLEADAQFAAWIWGSAIESQWTEFFKPISANNDTLYVEINAAADSIDFVRFSPKASEPSWEKQGENVVVWNEMKDKLYADSAVWTVIDWTTGQWKAYDRPCQEFGLLIDGEYRKAKHNVNQTEWLEYMLRGVELTKGQKLEIKNACNGDTWVISKFSDTSFTFEIKDGKYVVAESGKYDFYFKFIYGNDEIYVAKEGTYTTAVRHQCEDVMMQAFFNDSYKNDAPGVSEVGNTRWTTLTEQAEEIGHYIDLVWLPPSANGEGMGYHPKNYSNQNSEWGTRAELEALIAALHNAGAKVIADIVINHCQSSTGWCGFPEFDFGEYGKFHPDASYICKNDEVNMNPDAGECYGAATGNYDDGENWDGARDWAHDMPKVQDMFKAYLKWMKNVIGYDGWRYDKGDGFNNWHHDNYNKASNPYIAFMECYSGTDEIKRRIGDANYNLMGLDFDLKWHVFNSFAGWDYSKGRGDCLMSRGDGRHAVTFIDSHDWFMRSDNENEFGGRGNSLTDAMKCRLLQANAFMLSMPGIPSVFYPHWAKYKEFIKPMIEARKLAGVHSESEVKDEYATATGYQATIVGKYGYLILCLGDKAHQDFSSAGYECKASYYETNDCGMGKDASYQIWVNRTAPIPTGVEQPTSDSSLKGRGEKFVQDGQLYIRLGEKVYDATGKKIK